MLSTVWPDEVPTVRTLPNKNAESIQNKQTKSIQSISPFKEIIHRL
jgi:hypothetical protein